jgi:hypothetical protein
MTMKPCLHRTRVCRSRWWWRCDGIRDAYGVKYHRYMAIIGLVNLPDYSGASPPLRAFLFASTPCQQGRRAMSAATRRASSTVIWCDPGCDLRRVGADMASRDSRMTLHSAWRDANR